VKELLCRRPVVLLLVAGYAWYIIATSSIPEAVLHFALVALIVAAGVWGKRWN